jgi:hypothetical protein
VSKDITTSGPSRRSIAKGAAWAVPAVSVAAAAPALAASPNYCTTNSLTVEAVCPPVLSVLTETRNVYFTVTNTGACTIKSGLTFTLTYGGLVNVQLAQLNAIQLDAAVLFTSDTTGQINRDIPAGGTVEIEIFPDDLLTLGVLGNATLTVDGGATDTSNFIVADIDPSLTAVAMVAICV